MTKVNQCYQGLLVTNTPVLKIDLAIGLRECGGSGEGAPGNADQSPEKLGSNVARRPEAGGLHWTPISRDEVRISHCY